MYQCINLPNLLAVCDSSVGCQLEPSVCGWQYGKQVTCHGSSCFFQDAVVLPNVLAVWHVQGLAQSCLVCTARQGGNEDAVFTAFMHKAEQEFVPTTILTSSTALSAVRKRGSPAKAPSISPENHVSPESPTHVIIQSIKDVTCETCLPQKSGSHHHSQQQRCQEHHGCHRCNLYSLNPKDIMLL